MSAAAAAAPILNQTVASDAVGDAGTGTDLSSLTVTSYTDGTVSFAVNFANRQSLALNETVQIFIDLNDDGKADLNLSVWSSGEPSYLDRWTGSDWTDIRQLPELVQSPGSISVTEPLSGLRDAAAVPVASTIQVQVGAWTGDGAGNLSDSANDWIPSGITWIDHSINPPTTTGPTRTATTTPGASGGARSATAPPASTPQKTATTKTVTIPVAIASLPALTIKHGGDAVIHVLLKSKTGPRRLFKICATAPSTAVAHYPVLCKSIQATGGGKPVPLAVTFKLLHPGTVKVTIVGAAGTAKASATQIVHVT